jgi:hypothetical protein
MADEAGSQPIGSGGCNFFNAVFLLRRTPWGHSARPAVDSNEGTVAPAREEPGVYERFEQFVAEITVQAPEPLRLGGSQAEAGHFYELALHSLKHVLNAHVDLQGLENGVAGR